MISQAAIARFQARQKALLAQTYDQAYADGADQSDEEDTAEPDADRRALALAAAYNGVDSMGQQLGRLSPTADHHSTAQDAVSAGRIAVDAAGAFAMAQAVADWADANSSRLDAGESVAWAGEQAGFGEAAGANDQLLAWQTESDDSVCVDCQDLGSMGALALEDWPTSPGSGDTACNVGCRCSWETVEMLPNDLAVGSTADQQLAIDRIAGQTYTRIDNLAPVIDTIPPPGLDTVVAGGPMSPESASDIYRRIDALPTVPNPFYPDASPVVDTHQVFDSVLPESERPEFHAGLAHEEDVPVSDLVATQQYVEPDVLRHAVDVPSDHTVDGVRSPDGKVVIVDGHHGAAASILRGDDTVRMRVEGPASKSADAGVDREGRPHPQTVVLDPATGTATSIPSMARNTLDAQIRKYEALPSLNARAQRNLDNLLFDRNKRDSLLRDDLRPPPTPPPTPRPAGGGVGRDKNGNLRMFRLMSPNKLTQMLKDLYAEGADQEAIDRAELAAREKGVDLPPRPGDLPPVPPVELKPEPPVDLTNSPGRDRNGNLRMFRQMSPANLQKALRDLYAHGTDPEAITRAELAASERGIQLPPKPGVLSSGHLVEAQRILSGVTRRAGDEHADNDLFIRAGEAIRKHVEERIAPIQEAWAAARAERDVVAAASRAAARGRYDPLLSEANTRLSKAYKALQEAAPKETLSALGELRPMGGSIQYTGFAATMERDFINVARYLPADWIGATNDLHSAGGLLQPDHIRGRAFYRRDGALKYRSGDVSTLAHELMHRMEHVDEGLLRHEYDLYTARTAGEQLEHIPGYPAGEMGRFDRFSDPYVGRDYGGSNFELASMAIQGALFGDHRMLERDPEMVYWFLGLIAGW